MPADPQPVGPPHGDRLIPPRERIRDPYFWVSIIVGVTLTAFLNTDVIAGCALGLALYAVYVRSPNA